MSAYYNENDAFAAAWLRNLISAGHIAPGEVDERSIAEVSADDLVGFRQCHFFAGIGVWSYALRQSGWPDDRPVWTGSCPCQPFSGAGKKEGVKDARHLWPVWFNLIRERRPGVILGEQVASRDGLAWWDIVSGDLEGEDYPCAALDLCVPGVGGPHIRQRLYWMAYADGRYAGTERQQRSGEHGQQSENGCLGGLALAGGEGLSPREFPELSGTGRREERGTAQQCCGASGGMVNTTSERHGTHDMEPLTGRRECAIGSADRACAGGMADTAYGSRQSSVSWSTVRIDAQSIGEMQTEPNPASPLNGFWRNADWLFCTDGKWRPVEPGSFPLAHGVAGRVGRLRAYGNAICAPQAVEFIKAASEAIHGH